MDALTELTRILFFGNNQLLMSNSVCFFLEITILNLQMFGILPKFDKIVKKFVKPEE